MLPKKRKTLKPNKPKPIDTGAQVAAIRSQIENERQEMPKEPEVYREISSKTYMPDNSGSNLADMCVDAYMSTMEHVRGQVESQLEPEEIPTIKDFGELVMSVLENADDEFILGLGMVMLQMEIEGGTVDRVIRRMIFDLQGGHDWIDLGDWD